MKPRTAWLLGGIGAAIAALRALRRPAPAPPVLERPGPDPRAEQLREKLAESRAAVDELERERTEDAETPVDEAVAPPEPETVEERRKRVHERGKATARKMRTQSSEPADE